MGKPLQFGYWNIRGLMQPIRLLCEYLDIDWRESEYDLKILPDGSRDPSEWTNEKQNLGLHFPNLPWMIDDETHVKLTQSNAILRYICNKYQPQLLGRTLEEQAAVDMLIGVSADFKLNMTRVAYGPHECYEAALEELTATAETYLTALQEYLQQKPYLIGQEITYADFVCYETLDVLRLMVPRVFASAHCFPQLQQYLERIRSLPKIAAYLASDACTRRPVNNKSAGCVPRKSVGTLREEKVLGLSRFSPSFCKDIMMYCGS